MALSYRLPSLAAGLLLCLILPLTLPRTAVSGTARTGLLLVEATSEPVSIESTTPFEGSAAVHEGGTTIILSTWEAGVAQGVPPGGAPRVSAGIGHARLTGDTAVIAPSVRLNLTLQWAGLSGPITVAHFHGPAWLGESGPVVAPVPLPALAAGTVSGLVIDVTAATWALMVQGRTYLNLHTARHPDGEIRGHVCFANCGFVGLFGESERPSPVSTPAFGLAQVSISADGAVTVNRMVTTRWPDGGEAAGVVPVAAHIHGGGPNVAGPILCPITPPAGPVTGLPCVLASGQPFTSAQLDNARNGGWYINVHTGRNPGGEIRGQIVFPAFLSDEGVWRTRGPTGGGDGGQWGMTGGQVRPNAVNTVAKGNTALTVTTAIAGRFVVWGSLTELSGPVTSQTLNAPATTDQTAAVQSVLPSFTAGQSPTGGVQGLPQGWNAGYSYFMVEPGAVATESITTTGRAYVTASTAANQGGEIRGQVGPWGDNTAGYAAGITDEADEEEGEDGGAITATATSDYGASVLHTLHDSLDTDHDGSVQGGEIPDANGNAALDTGDLEAVIPSATAQELMNILQEAGLTLDSDDGWDPAVLEMLQEWIMSGAVDSISVEDDDSDL